MAHNCHGCKYLYLDGVGYSDYTWEETYVTCALEKNDNLPIHEPWDYNDDMTGTLRWLATLACECDSYDAGEQVTITPDGNVQNFTDDDQQMFAILKHHNNDPDNINLDDCRKHETVHGDKSWT